MNRQPRRSVRRVAVTGGVIVALIATLIANASGATASGPPGDRDAYSRDATSAEDHSDWLRSVDGTTPIWQLSLPGTHDSYTAGLSWLGPSFQTQTASVPQQLKMGIRALDVRLDACHLYDVRSQCPHNEDDFVVEHGGVSTGDTLSDVLAQLQSFLSAHPAESVVLRAKVDNEGRNFAANFNAILDGYRSILWTGSPSAAFADPTLDQVRGKVVLLKEFPKTSPDINSYGMRYDTPGFVVQDDWNLKSNWSLYDKWQKVVDNWTDSVAYASTGGSSKGYINFLSGNGGSFPYFVASGYSSPSGSPLSPA